MTTKPGFHQTGGCFSSKRKGRLFSWCTWMPENGCSFPYFPPPPWIQNSTRLMFVLWTSSSLIPGLTWLHKSNCTLGLQTSGVEGGGLLLLLFFLIAEVNIKILLQSSLHLTSVVLFSPVLGFSSEFSSGEGLGVVPVLWEQLPPLTSQLCCRYVYKEETLKDLSCPYLTARDTKKEHQINSHVFRQC